MSRDYARLVRRGLPSLAFFFGCAAPRRTGRREATLDRSVQVPPAWRPTGSACFSPTADATIFEIDRRTEGRSLFPLRR